MSDDYWVRTSGSPPCWWWGYQSLKTGSKWAVIFPLAHGCQTHSVLRATFTYLDFIWARLEKQFEQARLYINGSQTYLSAGTGNQLMKFRGTPATQIYSY